MTTTGYEVTGALIITGMAMFGKIIEHSQLFHEARSGRSRGHASLVLVYYECANCHLHLSLGMLGLAWSQHWDTSYCGPILLFILMGTVFRGIIADSRRVATLRFLDPTAFLGLYVPNILAVLCVAWALFGKDIISNTSNTVIPSPSTSMTNSAGTTTTNQSTVTPKLP